MGTDSIKWFRAASKLFHEIWTDLGSEAEARRIFISIAGPMTPEQEREFRNMVLLGHYDTMLPEPNVQQLSQQLAEANKTLPVKHRFGPRGTTSSFVMEKQIRRLLADRRKLHARQRKLVARRRARRRKPRGR